MSKRISGAVFAYGGCWFIYRKENLRHYLWKNGTWHKVTSYKIPRVVCNAPGLYKTRKEAREVLKKYKESVHVCVVMDESSIITKKMIEKCKWVY